MSTQGFQNEIEKAYKLEDDNYFSGANHSESDIKSQYLLAFNELEDAFKNNDQEAPGDVDMQELGTALQGLGATAEAAKARRLRYKIKKRHWIGD